MAADTPLSKIKGLINHCQELTVYDVSFLKLKDTIIKTIYKLDDKDKQNLLDWLLSADKKNAFKIIIISEIYYFLGQIKKSLDCLEKEVDLNHPLIYWELANSGSSILIEMTNEKIFELRMKAANLNFSLAMVAVGNAFLDGEGTESNMDLAMMWFDRAIKLNCPYGYAEMGIFLLDREIKTDRVLAETYFEKCVEHQYGPAIKRIADFYWRELNDKAIYYYTLSTTMEDSYSMYKLGKMYYSGTIVEEDYKMAINWFMTSLNYYPNSSAYYYLGKIYQDDSTQFYDMEKAIQCFRKGAKFGDSDSIEELDEVYDKKDEKKMFELVAYYKNAFFNKSNLIKMGKIMMMNSSEKVNGLKYIAEGLMKLSSEERLAEWNEIKKIMIDPMPLIELILQSSSEKKSDRKNNELEYEMIEFGQ